MAGFPVGSLHWRMQAATSAETTIDGMLLEGNGFSVLRATYGSLNTKLSALSYPFGTADGTHMTLPDVSGRAPYAMAASGHADVNGIGDSDGLTKASRSPQHNTTLASASVASASAGTPAGSVGISPNPHSHTDHEIGAGTGGQTGLNFSNVATITGTTSLTATFSGSAMSSHGHTLSGSGGPGGTRPNDLSPWLVVGVMGVKY